MRISFDFDGCLSRPNIREICKEHISVGDYVRITTSRWENPNTGNNNDMLKIAEQLGISDIVYTHHTLKNLFMDGIDIHYDDNPNEEDGMNCKFILV